MTRSRRFAILLSALAMAATAIGFGLSSGPAGAAFPGKNGLIAFDSDGRVPDDPWSGQPDRIEVVNPDGSGRHQIIDAADLGDVFEVGSPKWSADGKKITFHTYSEVGEGEGDPLYQIWVMNADGTNPHVITNGMPGLSGVEYPAWSPDGTKIVFEAGDGLHGDQIWVMDADGNNAHAIMNTMSATNPAWSPDGNKIAFERWNDSTHRKEIWTMNPDGSSPTKLYDAQPAEKPEWSPDDGKIAFEVHDYVLSKRDIWVMDANGSNPDAITDDGDSFAPAWSPDGEKIAYMHHNVMEKRDEIWLMNPNGSGKAALVADGTQPRIGWPNWQPIHDEPEPTTTTTAHPTTTSTTAPPSTRVTPRFAG